MLEFKIKRLIMDESHGNNRRVLVGSDGGFGDFNLSYPQADAEQFYIGERVEVSLREVNEHDGLVPIPEEDRDSVNKALRDVRQYLVDLLTDGKGEGDLASCTVNGKLLIEDFDEAFGTGTN